MFHSKYLYVLLDIIIRIQNDASSVRWKTLCVISRAIQPVCMSYIIESVISIAATVRYVKAAIIHSENTKIYL